MKSGFSKVFLDEDVDLIVAAILRSHGFEAIAAQDVGRKGKSDSDQLVFASERGFAILTHNRGDYEALAIQYFDSSRSHSGIIIAVRRPAQEISTRTLHILNRFTPDEMVNQVYYI